MSSIPTYFLAPNFTLTASPSSPWYPWLGNIIPDPRLPTHRTLDKPASGPPSNVVIISEEENEYTTSKGRSLNASVWAKFLQSASAKLAGETSRDTQVKYSMREMETSYFEPTDEEVTERVESSGKVRAAMDAGLFGWKPVYMITGLKVAKGFRLQTSTKATVAGDLGASATVAPGGEVAVGAQGGGERHDEESASFKAGRGVDVIFAYQVHVIAMKGWLKKSRSIETEVLRSKQAFLGEEDEVGRSWEATVATKEDFELEGLQVGDLPFVEVGGEDEDKCMCVLAQMPDE